MTTETTANKIAMLSEKYPELATRIIISIVNYEQNHIPTGDFLRQVISNNLKEAFYHADDNNTIHMHSIVKLFYNDIASKCWGSPKIYTKWIAKEIDL